MVTLRLHAGDYKCGFTIKKIILEIFGMMAGTWIFFFTAKLSAQ